MTLTEVFHSVLEVVNLDRGIFRTLADLLVRPRAFFETFFFHDRTKYTKPSTLIMLMIALLLLCSRHLLPESDSYSPTLLLTVTATTEDEMRSLKMLREYDDVIRLLLVPITALLSYLLFRRQEWFYAEHLAFNAYILAVQFLLTVLSLPLVVIGYAWIGGIVTLAYFLFVYSSCMSGSKIFSAAKAFLVIVSANLLFVIVLYPLTV